MKEIIAVETMTLVEVSDMFRRSIDTAIPRFKGAKDRKMKELDRVKVSNQWVQTYEIFKGAKLNFYCQKIPKLHEPIVSIGMTHRTIDGMILISVDVSNGGMNNSARWDKWVMIYKGHACERYAERIMTVDAHTFQIGSDGIMFSDITGVARVIDKVSQELEEVEFLFKDGCYFGYRDIKSKIIYFKTVYSNDMLRGDRRAFRDEWQIPIGVLQELFKRN